MASDPQLRKDINDLQEKLFKAKARISELEMMPPKVVEKTVIKEVVKASGDSAELIRLKGEVERLRGELSKSPRTVIKEAPAPVQIKRVEVPVVKYVKCPKQAEIIKELRARLN